MALPCCVVQNKVIMVLMQVLPTQDLAIARVLRDVPKVHIDDVILAPINDVTVELALDVIVSLYMISQ